MMFISYSIIFSIIFGLILTKPIEENPRTNGKNFQDVKMDQAFRQAEAVLNRYFELINSDIDQVVHALLRLILNNPKSFSLVSHRALNIALRNVEGKLSQDDVTILTKPILLSMEQNAQNKSKLSSSYRLTDEMKEKIEDALDNFFAEHV